MEENLKRLAGQVARFLGLPETTVADYAESDDAIKGLGTAFKDVRTKLDTDGYQRGEERLSRKVEKAFKAKGIEAPDLDKLDDALDQLTASGSGKGLDQLSAEEIAKLPQVKKLLTDAENSKLLAVSEAGRQAEEKLKVDRENFAKEQLHAKVEEQGRKLIAQLNPNLNPDSAKAERQVSRLLSDLKSGNYKLESDGTLAPVDAEGKYLENAAHGNKTFAELVRETVTAEYDLPMSSPKDSPGVKPGEIADKPLGFVFKEFKGTAPKTKEEYISLANDTTLPAAALKEVQAYWSAKPSE